MLEQALQIYKEMLEQSIQGETDFDDGSQDETIKNALKESLKHRHYDDSLSMRSDQEKRPGQWVEDLAPFGVSMSDGTEYSVRLKLDGTLAIVGCSSESETLEVRSSFYGNNVTEIASYAFSRISVRRLILPDTIEIIAKNAFDHCDTLEELVLPASLDSFDPSWINACKAVHLLVLPRDVAVLKTDWFLRFPGMTVVLGSSTKEVERRSFLKPGRISFSVPDENHYLRYEGGAFYSANGERLISLVEECPAYSVAGSCTEIVPRAFSGASFLKSVSVPACLQRIGSYAFAGTGITEFEAPESLETIEDHAFFQCRGLRDVLLNRGLLSLGNACFAQTGVLKLNIPETVADMGNHIATWEAEAILQVSAANSWYYDDGLGGLYRRNPDGSLALQEFCRSGCDNYRVSSDTTVLMSHAFEGCSELVAIDLPNGLVAIEDKAFLGCEKLTQVELPASLQEVGEYAFLGTSLASVHIPAGVLHLADTAFLTRDSSISERPDTLREMCVDPACQRYCMVEDLLCERIAANQFRAIIYAGPGGVARVPETVTELSARCFFSVGHVTDLTLHDGIKQFDPNAFLVKNPPQVLRVHLVDGNDLTALFPKAAQVRSAFLACFNTGDIDAFRIFHYADALSLWADDAYTRAAIAIDRLGDGRFLSEESERKFREYLDRNKVSAVDELIERDDSEHLRGLVDLGILDEVNLHTAVDRATEMSNTPMASFLLNITRQLFGGNDFSSMYEL